MKAVILIGGKGERLKPLTESTRKAYLPLGNKRVIDHIIERLPKGMPYSISENDMGAGAAIAEALEGSEPIMVICGDNYFSEGFEDFVGAFRGHPLVGVYDIGDRELAKNYGVVEITKNHRLVWITEKPKNPLSTVVSTGIYIFPPQVFGIAKRFAEAHPRQNLGDFIKFLMVFSPTPPEGYLFKGVWFDIGDHKSYQKAQSIVK